MIGRNNLKGTIPGTLIFSGGKEADDDPHHGNQQAKGGGNLDSALPGLAGVPADSGADRTWRRLPAGAATAVAVVPAEVRPRARRPMRRTAMPSCRARTTGTPLPEP